MIQSWGLASAAFCQSVCRELAAEGLGPSLVKLLPLRGGVEGEGWGFILGCQNLWVLWKGGSDNPGDSGQERFVGTRLAGHLEMKYARSSSSLANYSCPFRAASQSGVRLGLLGVSGLGSLRSGIIVGSRPAHPD